MSFLENFRLAMEALFSNKLRATLTMLGMIIGVGAVVLLVSLGQGAKRYLQREFEGLGTNLIIVQPGKTETKGGLVPPMGGSKRALTLGDVAALERESYNLDAVTGVIFGAGSVKVGNRSTVTQILGTGDAFIRIINLNLAIGEFLSHDEEDNARRTIVLGYTVAKKLFPDGSPIGQLVKVHESEHRVVGVLAQAGELLGINMDNLAVIPTRSAMRLFNQENLFGIRAKAKAKVSIEDASEDIRTILMNRHNGEEDFTILTADKMMGAMDTVLNMLTYVLAGIAMISMLVGGIGIMNIMLVSVTERTREIGIRRAVGARKMDILKQFLTEALLMSITGGMIGLVGSVFLTYVVTFFAGGFDMVPPWWIMVPAFLLSLFVGVVFGVWPARKASNLETIDALRFE